MIKKPNYFRKVLRIKATDSPNVRLALEEQRMGLEPSGDMVVPGVLPWSEYVKRRATWDKIRQCIGLDAEFWEGSELLLFPPEWLNRAEAIADSLKGRRRVAKAIGADTAAGGDKTVWCVVDELGIIEMISMSTSDTSVITDYTKGLMRRYGVPADKICFDVGGGGKEHADRMRREGIRVKTVAFGERVSGSISRLRKSTDERKNTQEQVYAYKNRRAEMYGELSLLLDPNQDSDSKYGDRGFGIPSEYTELRRQLSPIPKRFDGEGRLELPPKRRNRRQTLEEGKAEDKSLEEIIGCSPDEVDALVVAFYALRTKSVRLVIGAL